MSRTLHFAGEGLDILVMEPIYFGRIVRLLEQQRSLVVFNRGGMIWASGGIVYDASDQIMFQTDQRSATWVAMASHSELSCEPFQATLLWGHFCTADLPCQRAGHGLLGQPLTSTSFTGLGTMRWMIPPLSLFVLVFCACYAVTPTYDGHKDCEWNLLPGVGPP